MKKCVTCLQEKPEEEFNWRYKALGVRARICRECQKKHQHTWYIDHRTQERDRTRRKRMRATEEAREFIYSYLSKHPCVDCGEKDLRVLDFDHIKGKTKSVSELARSGASVERIKIEIGLCVIRCANCHRKKTSAEFKWRRSRK